MYLFVGPMRGTGWLGVAVLDWSGSSINDAKLKGAHESVLGFDFQVDAKTRVSIAWLHPQQGCGVAGKRSFRCRSSRVVRDGDLGTKASAEARLIQDKGKEYVRIIHE